METPFYINKNVQKREGMRYIEYTDTGNSDNKSQRYNVTNYEIHRILYSEHTDTLHTYMIVVIGFVGGRVPHDSPRIVLEGYRVDRRLHGTTRKNLGLHGKHVVMVGTVFGDGRVGKLCHGLTVVLACT